MSDLEYTKLFDFTVVKDNDDSYVFELLDESFEIPLCECKKYYKTFKQTDTKESSELSQLSLIDYFQSVYGCDKSGFHKYWVAIKEENEWKILSPKFCISLEKQPESLGLSNFDLQKKRQFRLGECLEY